MLTDLTSSRRLKTLVKQPTLVQGTSVHHTTPLGVSICLSSLGRKSIELNLKLLLSTIQEKKKDTVQNIRGLLLLCEH